MTIFRTFPALSCLILSPLFLSAACGGPAQQSETAEEYAARINGSAPVAAQAETSASGQQSSATLATPLPGAAPGSAEPGPQTSLATSPCGTTSVAEYLGQSDTSEIRQAIVAKAQAKGGIRFIRPGEAQTQDFNNNRLNVMYDATGVIRDFRCG